MEQLGVADLAQGLAEARQLWQDWVEQDPRLASAPAVDGLRDWLMLVGIDAADEVLHALVQIGSPSGKDCRPAAWVVAWALLPGAIAVARRAPAGPETDALVASQLWLEIRQFPWWRHQKVAGNVLANMRSALAREGVLKRPSWAERRTVPTDRLPEQQLHKQVSPSEELIDVLSWGEQVGLIGSGDRLLLSSLVEQTDRLGVRTVCRSGQGLMSASALAETAAEFDLAVEVLGHLAELHMTATLSSSATRCSIVNLGLKAARTMLTRCFRPSTPCVCAETRDSKLCRNVVERRDAQRQVDDALPWIVASGPPITTPGGHCGYLGGEVSGADEIVAAVRERVERRVDVVKVMASGGMATTGSDVFVPQFLIEELRLLVEQAHAAGLPVTAHAHSAAAVDQGVAAGVEGIEHASSPCNRGTAGGFGRQRYRGVPYAWWVQYQIVGSFAGRRSALPADLRRCRPHARVLPRNPHVGFAADDNIRRPTHIR